MSEQRQTTMDSAVDEIVRRGGVCKLLPSGRVEIFLPLGDGWRRKYFDRRSGEASASPLYRALMVALQAEILAFEVERRLA